MHHPRYRLRRRRLRQQPDAYPPPHLLRHLHRQQGHLHGGPRYQHRQLRLENTGRLADPRGRARAPPHRSADARHHRHPQPDHQRHLPFRLGRHHGMAAREYGPERRASLLRRLLRPRQSPAPLPRRWQRRQCHLHAPQREQHARKLPMPHQRPRLLRLHRGRGADAQPQHHHEARSRRPQRHLDRHAIQRDRNHP